MGWLRSRGVSAFVVRRVLLGVLVMFLVSIVVFAATEALGSPARAILGRQATPSALAALNRQLHLDRPLLDQFWTWFTGVVGGNFGHSLSNQVAVTTYLGPRVVN